MNGVALRHARVRYGPLEALHGVTLAAPAPGLTVLLGRHGSGRTTALRALAGTGRILEINTKSPLASVDLVRWWREAGGTAVSFGSDAHLPMRVGDRFKLAVDVVEAAGFRPGNDPYDFWRV